MYSAYSIVPKQVAINDSFGSDEPTTPTDHDDCEWDFNAWSRDLEENDDWGACIYDCLKDVNEAISSASTSMSDLSSDENIDFMAVDKKDIPSSSSAFCKILVQDRYPSDGNISICSSPHGFAIGAETDSDWSLCLGSNIDCDDNLSTPASVLEVKSISFGDSTETINPTTDFHLHICKETIKYDFSSITDRTANELPEGSESERRSLFGEDDLSSWFAFECLDSDSESDH